MFVNKFDQEQNVCCGLIHIRTRNEYEPEEIPIPLRFVSVKASVVHAVAQVEVCQTYVNVENQPIEAIYYFPMNPDGAVTHFQAELEDRVIKGVVKKHDEAKKIYEKAVKNQMTAVLGEETNADIFKVCVGFLKPGVQVKVTIGYVTEVKNEPGSNAIRFYIPTTIAPRYVSLVEKNDKSNEIGEMNFSESTPAPLSLKVAVSIQGRIQSIESPTHKVKVEKAEPILENQAWYKSFVELDGETTDMDRDFVLLIIPEEVHKPRLYTERLEDGSTAAMLHLIPSFKFKDHKTELIFVLDRSGSMSGLSIGLAKSALLLFLHSMPADCYFNLVGFGSSFKFLFPTSVKYDDKTLKRAVAYTERLDADMGGTEILTPLNAVYAQPDTTGYRRQIFLLTDGEVSDTERVIGLAKKNAHRARVFALGIGDAASHYLVEGVAKAGGGTAAFVSYEESMERKVLNQLKNSLQPSLSEIDVDWEIDVSPPSSAPKLGTIKTLLGYIKSKEASSSIDEPDGGASSFSSNFNRIPPLYDGSQLLVFGIFQDECPKAVSVKAESPDGPLAVKVEHSPENDMGSTEMLHRLAAVKKIRHLEQEIDGLNFRSFESKSDCKKLEEQAKKYENEIISISCKAGITSRYTSFVIVDDTNEKPSMKSWVMIRRLVPSQLARGWGGKNPHSIKSKGFKRRSLFRMPSLSLSMPLKRMSLSGRRKACSMDYDVDEWRECHAERLMAVALTSATESGRFDDDSEDEFASSNGQDQDVEDGGGIIEPPIVSLIRLQSFDGSYTLTTELSRIVEHTLEELKKCAADSHLEESVYATALAISYFTNALPEEMDIWELVVLKAKKWLEKMVPENQVEATIKTVGKVL